FPAGISVKELPGGPVYVDARGLALYGLDMRTLLRWGADPSRYCAEECAQIWEPVLAPPGTEPNIAFPLGFGSRGRQEHIEKMRALGFYTQPEKAPDWTVIDGPQGPQWVYKGWHMVFTRKGDESASADHDGA